MGGPQAEETAPQPAPPSDGKHLEIKSIRRGRFSVVTHRPEEIEEVVPLNPHPDSVLAVNVNLNNLIPGGGGSLNMSLAHQHQHQLPSSEYNSSPSNMGTGPQHQHQPTELYYGQGPQYYQQIQGIVQPQPAQPYQFVNVGQQVFQGGYSPGLQQPMGHGQVKLEKYEQYLVTN